MALGMPVHSTIHELIEENIKRKKKPIPPVIVKDGPCLEHVHLGDKVELFKSPVPLVHEGDGGATLVPGTQ